MATLTFGIVQTEALGLRDSLVWAPMPAGALRLSGHVTWGRGRSNAAIDMSLFQDRPHVLVTVAPFVFGAAFAMTFLASFLFLLQIRDFGQGLTGVAVTPGPPVVIPVAVTSGGLAGSHAHRTVIVTGGLVFGAGQMRLATQVTEAPAHQSPRVPLQVIGKAAIGLSVAPIAQRDTPLEGFRTAIIRMSLPGIVTAVIAPALPARSGLRTAAPKSR